MAPRNPFERKDVSNEVETSSSSSEVSIPIDEVLVTPVERRLLALEAARKQRSSEGRQETIAQQREYEQVVWANLISDLGDLKMIAENERSSSASGGHIRSLDVLIAAGYLPKEIIQEQPIRIQEATRDIALKRLKTLQETHERLSMLDVAVCLPSEECARLQEDRSKVLAQCECDWGLN